MSGAHKQSLQHAVGAGPTRYDIAYTATLQRLLQYINQGLYSLSGRTSYRKISWSLEDTRFRFRLFQML